MKRLSWRNYLKGFLKTTFEDSLSTNYIDSQKERLFLCLQNYLIFQMILTNPKVKTRESKKFKTQIFLININTSN